MKVADLFAELHLQPDHHSFDVGEKLLDHVKEVLVVIAGFESVEKIKELMEGVTETAVQAEHLSQKIGVSVEQVQKLGYAADVSGASAEMMQVGMQHLARIVEHAKTKGGEAAAEFKKLGISMHDPAIKSGDLNQVLLLLADKFQKMPDGAEKTSIAMQLLGRSGANLIPLLNKGRAGITELGDELESVGGVIDEKSVKQFEKLEETQKRLGAAWRGAKIQIAEALLPTILEMTEGLMTWLKANKELIAQRLEQIISAIIFAVKQLATAVGLASDGITWLGKHSDIAKLAIISLGAAMLILKAEAVESAIATALAWGIATIEFVAVAVAIAAIILALKFLWDNSEQIGDFFAGLWHEIAAGAEESFDSIKSDVEGVINTIEGWIDDVMAALDQALALAVKVGHYASHPWEILGDIGRGIGHRKNTYFDENAMPSNTPIHDRSRPVRIAAPSFHAEIHINAPHADAAEVGRQTREQLQEFFHTMVRDAAATTGGT